MAEKHALASTVQVSTESKMCPHNNQVSCNDCRLGTICLPLAMEDNDIVKLDEIVQRGRPLQKGAHIYRANDDFSAVYAVRSGTIKTYRVTNDGQEQITGFYFPGEILGMDGIGKGKYANSAKTLETAAICEIPFEHLEKLSTEVPNLQRHFFQLMSQEITADQQLITLLSKNSADERIAALLISISARMVRRKLSGTQFRLPMSRTDIGNFLGLTIETVSRVFSRFKKQELVEVDGKEIILKNIDGLRDIADM